jgi:hypothetical protein
MARPPRAPATIAVPLVGTLDQRLGALADAINRKPDATLEPTYNAILLRAPDGSTWRVTLTNSGTFTTSQVPRT